MGQRSKSAHGGVRNNVGPAVVVEEDMQTKDNKNNTMIAKRASSHPDKDKSPSVRKLDQETDDEYTQYLCSVDRYRQNNPNPKPFRPITTRSDAIAAPLRKLSDQSGGGVSTVQGGGGGGGGQPPVRQQSFSYSSQAKSK